MIMFLFLGLFLTFALAHGGPVWAEVIAFSGLVICLVFAEILWENLKIRIEKMENEIKKWNEKNT